MKHGPIRCGTAAAGGAKGDDPRSATGTARLPLPAASPAVVGKAANPLRRGGEEPPRETAGCRRELAGDAARTRQAAQSERPKGNTSGPKETRAAQRKMGPASLPTPLSPMRGPAETGAWHPAVSRSRTGARDRVRRRRSHRHPETPSCHLARPLGGEPLRKPGGKTLDRHFRDRTFLVAGALSIGVASDRNPPLRLRGHPTGRSGPWRNALRLFVIERRMLQTGPCIRLSQNRRGQVSPRLSG